jgi:hypothetical protein
VRGDDCILLIAAPAILICLATALSQLHRSHCIFRADLWLTRDRAIVMLLAITGDAGLPTGANALQD